MTALSLELGEPPTPLVPPPPYSRGPLEVIGQKGAANVSLTTILNSGLIPDGNVTFGRNLLAGVALAGRYDIKRNLLAVTVHYSAGVAAQVTVTVTLLSTLGGSWNEVLLSQVIAAAGQDVIYQPTQPLTLDPADQIQVVAPAGGAAVVAGIAFYSIFEGLPRGA